MKKILVFALSGALVVVAATVAIAANNPQRSDQVPADCDDMLSQKAGSYEYDGVVVAWPPNHKYRTATITLTEEPDADMLDDVTVSVAGTHDQMVSDTEEMNGAGNTDPATDVIPGAPGAGTGSASTTVQFRGERSGRDKTGRTYTFDVIGTTDSGATECAPVSFTATVPHDQRKAK
jgi:hypothetical protein